jgi:parvulin-like peptidyl-prolyl isomerase
MGGNVILINFTDQEKYCLILKGNSPGELYQGIFHIIKLFNIEEIQMKISTAFVLIAIFIILVVGCGKQEQVPEKAHAAHILLMYKGSASASEEITRTKEEAYQEIQNLLERVKAGEDFAELAKEFSNCPSGKNGGDLGDFSKGDMVKPFEDAAFSLKKDEISGIVETRYGFHIIKRLN